jgi:ribonuclease HII
MRTGVNLNELSYRMIETMLLKMIAALPAGTSVSIVCDAVGPCDTMRARLERLLGDRPPGKDTVWVQPRADSEHVSVQAASVVAKVTRDRAIAELQTVEACGSGYSSDAKTIEWLAVLLGRPAELREPLMPWVRTSWSTWERLSRESALAARL